MGREHLLETLKHQHFYLNALHSAFTNGDLETIITVKSLLPYKVSGAV
jgi:hypothetical protein